MTADRATEGLLNELTRNGCSGRVISIERLPILKRELDDIRESRTVDPGLYRKWLSEFRFEAPEELPGARSVLVIATPRPLSRFTFGLGDREMSAFVPPSYLYGERDRDRVERILAAALEPWCYSVAEAVLPTKRLAAESGLARYGRNNIAYVRGMGSFLRLDAFFSDLPCETDGWREPQMMERCLSCDACLRHCPTGAIPRDRFLLRAERCIPFHNEEPNDVPFPDWLEPSVHHCLVGCMRCQTVCPENAEHIRWVEEGARFGPEETELLAKGVPLEELPPDTVEKLERSDLIALIESLGRNLRTLLESAVWHDAALEGRCRVQEGRE